MSRVMVLTLASTFAICGGGFFLGMSELILMNTIVAIAAVFGATCFVSLTILNFKNFRRYYRQMYSLWAVASFGYVICFFANVGYLLTNYEANDYNSLMRTLIFVLIPTLTLAVNRSVIDSIGAEIERDQNRRHLR